MRSSTALGVIIVGRKQDAAETKTIRIRADQLARAEALVSSILASDRYGDILALSGAGVVRMALNRGLAVLEQELAAGGGGEADAP